MSDDLEDAVPVKLVADVSPEKIVAFFGASEDNPLQAKDITEEDLASLSSLMLELDSLSKLVEMKKADLKRVAGGSDTLQRGKYLAIFKTVKGRSSFDHKRFIADKIGKPTEEDMKQYSSQGEPSVRFEGIRRLD